MQQIKKEENEAMLTTEDAIEEGKYFPEGDDRLDYTDKPFLFKRTGLRYKWNPEVEAWVRYHDEFKYDTDKSKTHLLLDFSRALTAIAEVTTFGAKKYSDNGWLHTPDGKDRYTAAMLRHLLAESNEMLDHDSCMPHEYMVAWNALARLELMLRDEEET